MDPSQLIAQTCPVPGSAEEGLSEFFIKGRGGLPLSPTRVLQDESVVADWVELEDEGRKVEDGRWRTEDGKWKAEDDPKRMPLTMNSKPISIVEAQGWMVGPQGKIVLTARAPGTADRISEFQPYQCEVGRH